MKKKMKLFVIVCVFMALVIPALVFASQNNNENAVDLGVCDDYICCSHFGSDELYA